MKWLKKVAETPLTGVAKVIDSLAPQVNDRTNSPSIAAVREATSASWDIIYPVGSIYLSINDTNPSSVFGGTWNKLKDRFLLGSGDTYQSGSTGGSATHTPSGTVGNHALSVDEIPSHRHFYDGTAYAYSITVNQDQGGDFAVDAEPHMQEDYAVKYTGGSQAHNHSFTGNSQNTMPPYLVVNMWVRVA